MAPTRAGDNTVPKRRGRPPGSRNSGASASRVAKPKKTSKTSSKPHTISKSRKEDGDDELSLAAPPQAQPSRTRKHKPKPDNDLDEIAGEPTRAQKKYVQLETKTKRIPQSVVETWPHLPQPVLEQISTVIKDAKKDIANTQRDERKVMAAHNSLNPLVRRLVRHIAASKIPPQARDYHFNIDKLTERNGQVFHDVTTARHSKQILDEQVNVAQKLLTRDEKALVELRSDVKNWKTEWKHQHRHGRSHPHLRDREDVDVDDDGPTEIRLKRAAAVDTTVFDTPDTELAPLLEQLRRSLENMQGNHAQVAGVDQAMTDAQTALDDVLFRYANAQQYAAL